MGFCENGHWYINSKVPIKVFRLSARQSRFRMFQPINITRKSKIQKKIDFHHFSPFCWCKNFFCGSQKIRKIRFFKKCSLLLLNDHTMSETCLGTFRDPYSSILTCYDGLLLWCKKMKILKNRIFLENSDFLNFCYFMGGWLARW